ncbi:hypothetical protein [Methanogenium cariaci]|uniref:hypothetical protein n=1 Tax=Methanogenium cariaci TaxID=2197 RepID=UPI001FE23200|nr:hypothetical protein [Methanogenium cariaci]
MGDIKIVGTAHVSQKSVDEVTDAIETFEPQIVAVELDRGPPDGTERGSGTAVRRCRPERRELLRHSCPVAARLCPAPYRKGDGCLSRLRDDGRRRTGGGTGGHPDCPCRPGHPHHLQPVLAFDAHHRETEDDLCTGRVGNGRREGGRGDGHRFDD